MQLQWLKDRDPQTTSLVHTMFDHSVGKHVARIQKVRRGSIQYQVQILDRVPWHRKSLKIAKSDCEHIYVYTKR